MTNGPESADAPRRSRRAAGSGTAAGAQERESQQRARDREALRAYKALTDSQPRPERADDANPPTRRQLRLAQQAAAQQAAQQAAQRAAQQANPAAAPETPAVPAASAAPVRPAVRAGSRPTETQATRGVPAAGVTAGGQSEARQAPGEQQAAPQPVSRRERRRAAAAAASASAVREASAAAAPAKTEQAKTERKTEQAQAGAKPAPAKPAPAQPAPAQPAPAAPVVQPVTPAPERAPAVQDQATAQQAAGERSGTSPQAKPAAAPEPNADVANMSVEQALAAREALKHQARNQVAAMEALQQSDPHAVDLELLAQQRALAERAAVLNRRTQNIQRLAQENEQRRSTPSDPTTAHNLAMVTPLEFVEVPGLERPVMKPPPTSHVPVVTSSNPAARKAPAAGRVPGTRRPGSDRRPAGAGESAPAASAEVRHSKILARADALVNAPLEADQGAKPVGARSAFGLDPLDVMTAGLGRTRRIRFVSLGIVGAGLIALALGVLMIVGGLGS